MKDYMKDVTVEEAIKAGHRDTICWDCKKAMCGGCSWSDPEQTKPVEGWNAKKTGSGYLVYSCPLFDRDTYACGRYRTADDYILALEIGLEERKRQLAKLKNLPDLLRKKNSKLMKQNENLVEKIDAEMWWAEVHLRE